jgi:hypothetical protein
MDSVDEMRMPFGSQNLCIRNEQGVQDCRRGVRKKKGGRSAYPRLESKKEIGHKSLDMSCFFHEGAELTYTFY